jgi:hypothetical protein
LIRDNRSVEGVTHFIEMLDLLVEDQQIGLFRNDLWFAGLAKREVL